MARVYYRWVPAPRGLTGAEYIGQFLNQYFPNVSYTEVVTDGSNHYGYVEGSGDQFRKALRAIEDRFAAQKLTEQEFIGAVRVHYQPVADLEMPTPPTWDQLLANHGITVDTANELDYVRAFKLALLKEQAKTKFPEWNDSLADVAKAIFAKLVWYAECTTDEQTAIDTAIDNIKTMYTKEACIAACNSLATNLTGLSSYYTAKSQVLSATTIDDIMAVDME